MMLSKIKSFYEHGFVRNVALLQAGSFMGNFLQAGAGVIIARLLQPERFGLYTLALSLAGMIAILLGSGAQDAAATIAAEHYAKKDDHEFKQAFAFLLKLTTIAGFLALVGALFAPLIARHLYGKAQIGEYAAIIVAASIVSTTFFSFGSLGLQVAGRIGWLSFLNVIDPLTRFGTSVFLVISGFGIFGAVSGHFLGALIVAIIAGNLWHWLRSSNNIFPSLSSLIAAAKAVPLRKYLGFSIWIAIDRNLGMLYMTLPVFLTGIFVSLDQVAFFKLAFGFMNLALSLLAPISVLLNVEFPKMKIADPRALAKHFTRISLFSLGMSLILAGGVVIVAPIAFNILYGTDYVESVQYVRYLFIYGALFGIGAGLGPMWRTLRKVKTSIVINGILLAVGIPFGILLIRHSELMGAVIWVTIIFTVAHLVSFLYIRQELTKLEKDSIKV